MTNDAAAEKLCNRMDAIAVHANTATMFTAVAEDFEPEAALEFLLTATLNLLKISVSELKAIEGNGGKITRTVARRM